MKISTKACVTALASAAMSQKRAVHAQMAVGLALFAVSGKKAEEALVAAYARAGLDCATYEGSEYNTVRRKVAASSKLFKKLGAEQVTAWVGDTSNAGALAAIAAGIEKLGLDSIEKVLAHCGAPATVRRLPSSPKTEEPPHRRATDNQPCLFKLELLHVAVRVTPDATNQELEDAIAGLQDLLKVRMQAA